MTEQDIMELQHRIDVGVRLAQKRLWERARATRQSLIVVRNGKIEELVPEEKVDMSLNVQGDPLQRRWKNR